MTNERDAGMKRVEYDPKVAAWLRQVLGERDNRWLITALYRLGTDETERLIDEGVIPPEGEVVSAFWQDRTRLESALLEDIFQGDQAAMDDAICADIFDQIDEMAAATLPASDQRTFPPWKNHWT